MNFDNPLGWYAFLAIIPLVIMYLRRPRPLDQTIPSLMFYIKRTGLNKKNILFRQLIKDFLFLIQLLALTALAFALTAPYLETNKTFFAQDTVLVIDASASSQTKIGSTTRFDKEIAEAKTYLEGKISIIVAENVPVLVLEKGGKQKALQTLSTIQPKDTPSNLGEAMLLAADIVERGKVVVLSDFIHTEGQDPLIAQRAITSKGAEIELVDVSGEAENFGIIDLLIDKHKAEVKIKNFNKEEKKLTLLISNKGKGTEYKRTVPARSVEIIEFDTPAGLTRLSIKEKDDLMVDNEAFISAPENKKISTLLVTNREKSYLQTALSASPDIDLTIYEPPVIPKLDFDVIIFYSVNTDFLMPSFFPEIKEKVDAGAAFIVVVQDDLSKLNFDLPVEIKKSKGTSKANTKIVNQLTRDLDFGVVSKYFEADAKNNTITIVEADDSSPLITLKEQNDGMIIYYGLFDDYSDFKSLTGYPIFWNNLLSFLTKTENINDYNTKTGKIESINKQKVNTPSGTIETSKLFFDKTGFYELSQRTIAANLINEKESDVSKKESFSEKSSTLFIDEEAKEKQKKELQQLIIAFALFMVFLEMLYIKYRGDI